MKILLVAASFLALMGLDEAVARDVVGQAFVNDRTVYLYDDGTWAYETKSLAKDCQRIDQTVQICDTANLWRRSTGPTYGYDALFLHALDNTYQAAIASHPFGKSVGNSFDGVMAHFIKGAAETDGISIDAVRVLDVTNTEVAGFTAKRFTLTFPQNGLWQVNTYTAVVEDDFSVYALTWSAGDKLSSAAGAIHASFVESVSISLGKSDQ